MWDIRCFVYKDVEIDFFSVCIMFLFPFVKDSEKVMNAFFFPSVCQYWKYSHMYMCNISVMRLSNETYVL